VELDPSNAGSCPPSLPPSLPFYFPISQDIEAEGLNENCSKRITFHNSPSLLDPLSPSLPPSLPSLPANKEYLSKAQAKIAEEETAGGAEGGRGGGGGGGMEVRRGWEGGMEEGEGDGGGRGGRRASLLTCGAGML